MGLWQLLSDILNSITGGNLHNTDNTEINLTLQRRKSIFGEKELNEKTKRVILRYILDDKYVIGSWKRLYGALQLRNEDLTALENRYKFSFQPHDLFSDILDQYISVHANVTVNSFCIVLKKENFDGLADKILKCEDFDAKEKSIIRHGITRSSTNFVGRKTELETLEEQYSKRREHGCLAIITGMGGIGKTEVAKVFAWELIQHKHVNSVWLHGETEQDFISSITNFLDKYFVKVDSKHSKSNLCDQFVDSIGTTIGNWLIVIDNVDEVNNLVDSLIEKLMKADVSCFIVITCRNLSAVQADGENIDLDKFNRDESIDFIKNALRMDLKVGKNYQQIIELCELVQDFPLALRQAVGYIKMQKKLSTKGKSFDILSYKSDFEANPESVLNFELSDYKKTTFRTYNVIIQKLVQEGPVGEVAMDLLRLLAYFAPDGIDLLFLQRCYNLLKETSSISINSSVRLIKSYCLIKCEDNVISIHRLVQEVTRVQNDKDWLLKMAQILNLIVTDRFGKNDILHVLSFWKFISHENNFIQKFCFIPIHISNALLEFDQLECVSEFCDRSKLQILSVLDKNHLARLTLDYNIGRCYNYQKKYQESLKNLLSLSNELTTLFDDEYQLTLEVVLEIASVRRSMGQTADALELYQEVRRSCSKIKDKKLEIKASNGIALVLMDQEKYSMAYDRFEEVLEWRMSNLGNSDASSLRTMFYMAKCLFLQGDFHKSNKMYAKALEIKDQFPQDHPYILSCSQGFALTLFEVGDKAVALEVLREVLQLREEFQGPNDPETVELRDKYSQLCVLASSKKADHQPDLLQW